VEGLLVPPARSEDLARTIAQLATFPEERARLRLMGQLRAQTYSWERVVSKIEAYYGELLARPHQPLLESPAPLPLADALPPTPAPTAEALANGFGSDDFGL
jgi:hypothetical protein